MTVWRAIPGYEGRYEASDMGEVRSVPRGWREGRLKPQTECCGHFFVKLYDGKRVHTRYVHRMVLLAHVGPPEPGQEGAHNNGDGKDNRLSNLRWATKAENTEDRTKHGKHRRAMDERLALTPDEAEFVRANHKRIKQTNLAQMFGVHRSTIQRIHSGERNKSPELATTKIEKE